jgi:hypothetical protein
MQAQLAGRENAQGTQFTTAGISDRKTKPPRIYARATEPSASALGDLVAVLSMATAVGIVIYMILSMP